MSILTLLGVDTPFDPSHLLLRPCFKSVSTHALTAYRFLVALFSLATLVITIIDDTRQGKGGDFFAYFTHLSFIGLCAYFWAASVQGLAFVLFSRKSKPWYPLQRWGKFFQAAHLVLYSTVMTYPILVTIVYWILLAPSKFRSPWAAYSSISMHAANSAIIIIEFILNAMPKLPWLHLLPCIVFLGGYCGLAYVHEARTGLYVYDFLDPAQGPILGAYIGGIAVGEAVIFVIVWFLGWLKWRFNSYLTHLQGEYGGVTALDMRTIDNCSVEDGWVDVQRLSRVHTPR